MECKFQDDSSWYFIGDNKNATQTRIDVLFYFVIRRPKGADSTDSHREFRSYTIIIEIRSRIATMSLFRVAGRMKAKAVCRMRGGSFERLLTHL